LHPAPNIDLFPQQLLLDQDQDEDQVAGQPATFDPNFLNEVDKYLASFDKPPADEPELPFLIEENPPETYQDGSTTVPNVETEPSMDVDDHNVPSFQQKQIFCNLPPPVSAPPNIPGNNHMGDYLVPPPQTFFDNLPTTVCATFSINANGHVVQVDPFHTRSKSVIVQGPALVARLSTRAKKTPAKTNAERCELYRKKQKTKKEKDEEELRMLDAKNRALKAKETAIRNRVQRMKQALLRMGLGNYVY